MKETIMKKIILQRMKTGLVVALPLIGVGVFVFLVFAFFAKTESILAGPNEDLFTSKCGKCHKLTPTGGTTLGRGSAGPDLTGYANKRPLAFLQLYVRDPEAGRKQFADIYAREIQGKYKKDKKAVDISAADLAKIIELMK